MYYYNSLFSLHSDNSKHWTKFIFWTGLFVTKTSNSKYYSFRSTYMINFLIEINYVQIILFWYQNKRKLAFNYAKYNLHFPVTLNTLSHLTFRVKIVKQYFILVTTLRTTVEQNTLGNITVTTPQSPSLIPPCHSWNKKIEINFSIF